MIAKARRNGQKGLMVKHLERGDGIDFARFNLPRFDVARLEGNFDGNLVLRTGYRRVVLIKLQHRIVLVENLDADTRSGGISCGNAEDITVRHPRRTRAGELIIDLCPRRAVGDFNLKTAVGENV